MREQEIRRKIAALEAELANIAPLHSRGVRELAREVGMSPTTLLRIRQGAQNYSLENARKLLPYMSECPCCGAKTATQEQEPSDA